MSNTSGTQATSGEEKKDSEKQVVEDNPKVLDKNGKGAETVETRVCDGLDCANPGIEIPINEMHGGQRWNCEHDPPFFFCLDCANKDECTGSDECGGTYNGDDYVHTEKSSGKRCALSGCG